MWHIFLIYPSRPTYPTNIILLAEFEALTRVVMESSAFWDITTCIPLEVHPTFWRNMLPSSSGSKNNQDETGSKQSCACYLFHVVLLLGLFFDPEDEGDLFLLNVG
jgi:hypothetical protein